LESPGVQAGERFAVASIVAQRYEELDVWQLSREVRERTLRVTSAQPFAQYGWLQSQIARAAHSACANIAEGFGRYKPKAFANSLRISRASLLEVKEHLRYTRELNLVTEDDLKEISQIADRAIGALTRLIAYLETAKEP
jgi:four helix bundle protein